MKCKNCGCDMEEEYQEEGGEEEYSEESTEGEPEMEGDVMVEKVEVPPGKEELIKKKLMELGKMLASIK